MLKSMMRRAKRCCLVVTFCIPMLAQTQGCLNLSTNEARELTSTAVSQVLGAGANYIIGYWINRFLDVPSSIFSRLGT